jgi:hypothetical protein
MIFDFYGKWLREMYDKEGWKRKISMVLGICAFCHGFWLFAFFYWWTGGEFTLVFFLYAGINYVFTRIFLNMYKND